MPIVSGLPANPGTKDHRWSLSTKARDLPRAPGARLKVRIELIAKSLRQADRQMFALTGELEKAAPRMRPTDKKTVLEFLQIMHESWVMRLTAAFSRDALQEGRRVLSGEPSRRKEAAAAEAWLRRQLEGLGQGGNTP